MGQRKDGTHAVAVVDGAVRRTFSCKDPCEFIKQSITIGGESMGKPVLIRAGNNLATAIVDDAISGELKVYGAKKSKKAAHRKDDARPARL